MIKFKTALLLTLLAAIAVLAGCATGPKVHSVYNEQIDFTRYQTFAFKTGSQVSSPASSQRGYLTLADQYLQAAITRELTVRGYTQVNIENADVLVDIFQSDKEKITSRPSGPIRFDYVMRHRRAVAVGGFEQELHQYTEGTLVVRIVDQAKKAVVWESIAIDKVSPPEQEKMRAAIELAVSKMFMDYPVPGPAPVMP